MIMLYLGGGFINKVGPIKSRKDINTIKGILKKENLRNYLMFVIGINTGLKTTDLLNLKFYNLLNEKLEPKEYIRIGKKNYFINNSIVMALQEYMIDINEQDILNRYVFKSRNGSNPIERCQAYRILNNASKKAGLNLRIGTETMRKTFGYHFYMEFGDVKFLQKIFNHSSPHITLEYIGVKERKLKDYKSFNL